MKESILVIVVIALCVFSVRHALKKATAKHSCHSAFDEHVCGQSPLWSQTEGLLSESFLMSVDSRVQQHGYCEALWEATVLSPGDTIWAVSVSRTPSAAGETVNVRLSTMWPNDKQAAADHLLKAIEEIELPGPDCHPVGLTQNNPK